MNTKVLHMHDFKVSPNKVYSYGPDLVKVLSTHKKFNKVKIKQLVSGDVLEIPLDSAYLFLKRVYTIGEVAKIVQRKPDTIRRYERLGHLSPPKRVGGDSGLRKWRFYTQVDAADMLLFFSERKPPGRPANKKITNRELRSRIRSLNDQSKRALENFSE